MAFSQNRKTALTPSAFSGRVSVFLPKSGVPSVFIGDIEDFIFNLCVSRDFMSGVYKTKDVFLGVGASPMFHKEIMKIKDKSISLATIFDKIKYIKTTKDVDKVI